VPLISGEFDGIGTAQRDPLFMTERMPSLQGTVDHQLWGGPSVGGMNFGLVVCGAKIYHYALHSYLTACK